MDETPVAGRRFGLTADTHDDLVDWPAILASLKAAWGEVDGVLHCGDLTIDDGAGQPGWSRADLRHPQRRRSAGRRRRRCARGRGC